jgi:hypothetical protein
MLLRCPASLQLPGCPASLQLPFELHPSPYVRAIADTPGARGAGCLTSPAWPAPPLRGLPHLLHWGLGCTRLPTWHVGAWSCTCTCSGHRGQASAHVPCTPPSCRHMCSRQVLCARPLNHPRGPRLCPSSSYHDTSSRRVWCTVVRAVLGVLSRLSRHSRRCSVYSNSRGVRCTVVVALSRARDAWQAGQPRGSSGSPCCFFLLDPRNVTLPTAL